MFSTKQGMKRYHARNAVIKALKEKGLYVGAEDNPMALSFCSKSGDIIEPLMKPQWWVKVQPMADKALEVSSSPALCVVLLTDLVHHLPQRAKAGELTIRPATCENEWYRWLANSHDWCISRQLWWGHRCPAYYVQLEGESAEVPTGGDDKWIIARTAEEAEKRARELHGDKKFTLHQDEDVLDTWFSSGLWPFSTVGWPNKVPSPFCLSCDYCLTGPFRADFRL